jgi:hypothetical protein
MKLRYHILIWLSLAASLVALARTFYVFPYVRVHEETDPAYEASANSYLRRCLSLMVPEPTGVHFVFANDNYGIMKATVLDPGRPEDSYPEWTGDFTLAVGESFMHRPDHHLSSRYTLKTTNATGVVIEYETRFDHRSFGKNLINVSKGKLRIPWQKKAANKASDATSEPARSAASSAHQG